MSDFSQPTSHLQQTPQTSELGGGFPNLKKPSAASSPCPGALAGSPAPSRKCALRFASPQQQKIVA